MIELDRDGDVFILRMSEGENRFNQEWLDAVNTALDRVETSSGPGALVTSGAGKFYTNGLDLDWLATVPGQADAFLAALGELYARMLALPVLTVAAVNGHAFGAGAVLAVTHDFVIMREDRGYWCLPEADLGLPLSLGMFGVIEAKLPHRTAQEAILTARRYGGRDAALAGIAHHAVAEDEVLPRAVDLAASLAAKNRKTTAHHKQLLYAQAIKACLTPNPTR
jgi:Delta3-Delta2-enoyl-CoA isomerase